MAQEEKEEEVIKLDILVILFLIASGVLLAYSADKHWIQPWFRRRASLPADANEDVEMLNGQPLVKMLKKSDRYETLRRVQEVSRTRSIGSGAGHRYLDKPGD